MNLAQFIMAKDFICHTSSDEAMRHSVISRSVSMCVRVCVLRGSEILSCMCNTDRAVFESLPFSFLLW